MSDAELRARELEDRLREAEKEVERLKLLYKEPHIYTQETDRKISAIKKERDAYREALLPFAEDYFSNKEEAKLNELETRHHGGAGYDACIYFADVKKAQEALKDPGLKGDA